jgi:cytochrome d ubiquinol oxidase subunit II
MDFLQNIDLAIVWSGILALAIIMYVLLDGFDLGIGILSKYAKDEKDQARMINSTGGRWTCGRARTLA